MKKLILLVLLSVLLPTVWAADGCNQHRLTREEFQAKQKAYIIEKAGLTSDEAARFFPVYFELQDRKKILQDEAWHLMREGNEKGVTEAKYEEILEAVLTLVYRSTDWTKPILINSRRFFPVGKFF